jgi:hypothetical protein
MLNDYNELFIFGVDQYGVHMLSLIVVPPTPGRWPNVSVVDNGKAAVAVIIGLRVIECCRLLPSRSVGALVLGGSCPDA